LTPTKKLEMSVAEEKLSGCEASEEVKQLLLQAAENWSDRAVAERYMNQALEKAGDNTDVLIAAYRLFFYSNNSEMALQMAEKVRDRVQASANLPEDWEALKLILIERKDDPQIRLYLNAYAASGFLLARIGQLEKAKEVTERIQEIDEKRESCSTTVFEVLTRSPEED
jgi:tetratricopeptide (TPR) repeat protein